MPSSSAAEVFDPAAGLRPRLVWITAFRTIAATLLLAIYGVRMVSRPVREGLSTADLLSLWLVGGIYAVVLVQAAFLRRHGPACGRGGARGRRRGHRHLDGLLTGGPESPFTFTYLLTIVGRRFSPTGGPDPTLVPPSSPSAVIAGGAFRGS